MVDANLKRMVRENPNFTFIFEYVALKDAHVVVYTKEQEGLYLIGIRDKTTGVQLSYNEVITMGTLYNIKLMTHLHNETIEEVLDSLDNYKSSEAEGVVLYIDGFMVKIKYNDYIQVHRLLSMISAPNLIIEAVADEWIDDLISKVPEVYRWRVQILVELLQEYVNKHNQIASNYFDSIVTGMEDVSNTREFMLKVNTEVPVQYQSWLRNKWLGKKNNWLKTHITSKTPHYKNLNELGLAEAYNCRLLEKTKKMGKNEN